MLGGIVISTICCCMGILILLLKNYEKGAPIKAGEQGKRSTDFGTDTQEIVGTFNPIEKIDSYAGSEHNSNIYGKSEAQLSTF